MSILSKQNKEKDLTWRKLDNTAKIFPIISNKKFSSVFRLSALLHESIHPEILQVALEETLQVFSDFKVRIKKGFFWYYFETNPKRPLVKKENNYPCKNIDTVSNHDYLFRISYYQNKINVEIFHSMTDGHGAKDFLQLLTYRYLLLTHAAEITSGEAFETYENSLKMNRAEDSYLQHYVKKTGQKLNLSYAYNLTGYVLPLYAIGVIHAHFELDSLLHYCKSKGVTLTEFFTAHFILAIYQNKRNKIRKKRPIKIYIPVNLKKYFNSSTVSNFFSYITVAAPEEQDKYTNFDSILSYVKHEFEEKLTKDNLSSKISSNVSTEKNLWIRLIPLFVKKYSVKLGYYEASKHHTSTISNLGKFEVLPAFEPYIENFYFLLPPSLSERIKCSISSYHNDLIFTFCSSLASTQIERTFLQNIASLGFTIQIESNGVYDEEL